MAWYAVTGGAGFIGSHLADHLLRTGHRITILDKADVRDADLNLTGALRERLEYFDVRRQRFVERYDGVFHLAAIARTPWCTDDPALACETNVLGTVNVLESARVAQVARVIIASSNVVYAANNPYRVSKECVDLWVRSYQETYGLSAQSLRFSNVYGLRQSEKGISPNVFAAFRKSKNENGRIKVTGDGTQTRQFTHVEDIVQGLCAAMRSSYVGEPIDLCHPRSWTMNEVVALFGSEPEYIPDRHMDVHDIVQSPDRAKKILGWEAKIDLEDRISDCFTNSHYDRA